MVAITTNSSAVKPNRAKPSRTKSLWHVFALVALLSVAFSGSSLADDTKSDSSETTTAEHATSEVIDSHEADASYTEADQAGSVDHATEGAHGGEHAEEHSEEHGEEHAEEHSGGSHELPNIISIVFGHNPNPTITDIQYWENVIFALLAGLFLVIVAQRAHSKRQMIPGKLQNVVEMSVEYFYDFFYAMLGEQTKRMMPLLGTLFFYILTMNLMGLVPFLKSPSTSINITLSLAIIVFFYSQYIGLKELGFKGWVDHLAGSPRDVTGWVLVPLMLPIHIIGEFAKPFSLGARLFGNITGEDIVIFALVGIGISLTGEYLNVGIPLQVLFIPLGLLFSVIQALVFTILSTIYLSLMLPQGDH